jgi:exodeoxyribonuclease VII small subunit
MSKVKSSKSNLALSFEAVTKEIESIVSLLEDSEAYSLEESLKNFEKGIELIRMAQKSLSNAEQKVTLLLERNGEMVAQEELPQ